MEKKWRCTVCGATFTDAYPTMPVDRVFREGIAREARAVRAARDAGRADVLRLLNHDQRTGVYFVTASELHNHAGVSAVLQRATQLAPEEPR